MVNNLKHPQTDRVKQLLAHSDAVLVEAREALYTLQKAYTTVYGRHPNHKPYTAVAPDWSGINEVIGIVWGLEDELLRLKHTVGDYAGRGVHSSSVPIR